MSKVKVKAIKVGFYNGSRQRLGSVFLIKESDFSGLWMEKVEEVEVYRHEPKKPKKSKVKPSEPEKVKEDEEELDVI